MAASESWRPLPLSSTDVPPLLCRFQVGTSDYTIQITDMANCWSESLERKSICIRAWGENTSIDPSDTPENMTKFLSCLRTALDASQPGHQDTSVKLAPSSSNETGPDGLTIQASCKLPGFPDLKWPFHLKKGSSSHLATDLVVPMTAALYAKQREMESLIQALKHKDSVISKLSDKLEATGTGLENVFTALAGRKGVARAAAEDKIRGLAPFDERKWKAELQTGDESNDTTQLIRAVFSSSSIQLSSQTNADSSGIHDGWWQDFRPTAGLAIRDNKVATSKARTPSPPPTAANAADDDDEFQVQSTPPHLKSSTNDESRSISIPVKRESPTPHAEATATESLASPKKLGGKLGAIGGKKKAAPRPRSPTPQKSSSPAPAPEPVGSTAMEVDGDETASETASDPDETASLPDEVPSSPPVKPVARKSGLGRIGGAPHQPTLSQDEKAEKDKAAPPATTSTSAPRKLGIIGNKPRSSGDTTSAVVDGDAERGRAATREQDQGKQQQQEQQQQQARETSQERADRKRDELKRDLEKKAAAGPAKKKRRF